MKQIRFLGRLAGAILAGFLLPACGSSDSGDSAEAEPAPLLAPDFQLVDMNPQSTTYNLKVSPRDFLGLVPGFYFTRGN